jgi:hypothetical protein
MLIVYFDRNVFSALSELEGEITKTDVEKIERAVDSGRVTILASQTIFEETITMLGRSDDMYRRHMLTVTRLTYKRLMIKQTMQLVLDDCYNYAVGLPENPRTMPIPKKLRNLLDLSANKHLGTIAEELKVDRGVTASKLTAALGRAREEGLRLNAGHPDNFDELWNNLTPEWIAMWVNRCRPEIKKKCYERGLKAMLNIKSIRFFTLYNLSVMHTGWFGLTGVPRRVKHGDVGDMFHAVSASAASIFVTLESKTKPGHLGHILSLKPTPGFEVLNLREFLKRI